MTKSRVTLQGAGGRMGGALIRCLGTGVVPELELCGAAERGDHAGVGQDSGRWAGAGENGIGISSSLEDAARRCDVIIDFSFHRVTAENAPRIAAWRKAWVIGTTGLTGEEQAAIAAAAREIPVVMAPNMSLGVNLLLSLVEQASRALKGRGYDIEIIERHHNLKKDAPSGTALALGAAAAAGYELELDEVARHGRAGITGERTSKEIGFHAVRAGDFVGDHTVLFATQGESIELSHRATNRDTFAVGALRAAAWVVGQPPGLYGMRDVLGLSA